MWKEHPKWWDVKLAGLVDHKGACMAGDVAMITISIDHHLPPYSTSNETFEKPTWCGNYCGTSYNEERQVEDAMV